MADAWYSDTHLLNHLFYIMCRVCLILPTATYYTAILTLLEDQFVWQYQKYHLCLLNHLVFPFPPAFKLMVCIQTGRGERGITLSWISTGMIVFEKQYFTEVRIRKRVDNHRQAGAWSKCLLGEKTWWTLFNMMWSLGLKQKMKYDCRRLFEFFFFNFQLSGLHILLIFFQTQMIVRFLGLILHNKTLSLYCSVLSIPSSHCTCLDFTKFLSIDFFP